MACPRPLIKLVELGLEPGTRTRDSWGTLGVLVFPGSTGKHTNSSGSVWPGLSNLTSGLYCLVLCKRGLTI